MRFFAIFAMITMISVGAQADGGSKFLNLWWWPSHWVNQDFVPNFDTATDPYNSQWDQQNKNWSPQDWITMDGGNAERLVQRWFTIGILSDRYVDGKVPVLVVGPNFYHLSGNDKSRVVQTVDFVYGAASKTPAMFYLEDWRTEEKIGYYTNKQLVLQ